MKDRKSRNSTSTKPGLGQRLGQRVRSAGDLGLNAVRDPASIPATAHGFFRGWFRKIWSVRGGGLYAAGYAVTFIWFSVQTLIREVSSSTGIVDFVEDQLFDVVLRFTADTIANMVKAFVWPVYVVEIAPPFGAIALGLAFVLFPRLLKKPIEKWLFDEPQR